MTYVSRLILEAGIESNRSSRERIDNHVTGQRFDAVSANQVLSLIRVHFDGNEASSQDLSDFRLREDAAFHSLAKQTPDHEEKQKQQQLLFFGFLQGRLK